MYSQYGMNHETGLRKLYFIIFDKKSLNNSKGSIQPLIDSYFTMQILCTLPVLYSINKPFYMLNTLNKPRFQTFVKIFQGLTDRHIGMARSNMYTKF